MSDRKGCIVNHQKAIKIMISINVYKEGYVPSSDYINKLITITVFENVTDLDLAINNDRR